MLGLLAEDDGRPEGELLLSSSSEDEERADSMYDGRLLVVLGLVAVVESKRKQSSAEDVILNMSTVTHIPSVLSRNSAGWTEMTLRWV